MTWRDLRGSASLWLAGVSVAVMLIVTIFPQLHDRWTLAGGFVPLRLDISVDAPIALVPALLTPLSSSFLHADWLHLAFNMLILLWCGRFVEAAIGKARLILLYVVGAYAAAAAQYFWDPISIIPVIGASGAVSAIFGAFALAYGRPKPVTQNATFNRAVHAFSLLVVWVAIQWMVEFIGAGQGYEIATPAHVGGFLLGLIAFPFLLIASGRRWRA